MIKLAVSYYLVRSGRGLLSITRTLWAIFMWSALGMKHEDPRFGIACALIAAPAVVPIFLLVPPADGRGSFINPSLYNYSKAVLFSYLGMSAIILAIRGVAWGWYLGEKSIEAIEDKSSRVQELARAYELELSLRKDRVKERGTLSTPHTEGGQLSNPDESGALSYTNRKGVTS